MQRWGPLPDVKEDIIGSATTVEEIVHALAKRGCTDLTSSINLDACSNFPRAGGGFCDVYRGALHDSHGTRIAIKSLRVYDGSEAEGDNERRKILKRAARELYHWSKLQHPNVLPLMGLAIFREQLSMVSEWMENGNLTSYLRVKPDANRNRLCMDVCEGLCYIHMNEMIHGDLKAANVVVSSRGIAMIADFGNTQLKDLTLKFSNTTKGGFSVRWAAPELLSEDSGLQVSKEADVYAYGMTVLETLTSKVPYDGMNDNQVLILVAVKEKVPPRPDIDACDDNLWDLLNWCWTREPSKRPKITMIQNRLQILFWPPTDTRLIGAAGDSGASPSTLDAPPIEYAGQTRNASSIPFPLYPNTHYRNKYTLLSSPVRALSARRTSTGVQQSYVTPDLLVGQGSNNVDTPRRKGRRAIKELVAASPDGSSDEDTPAEGAMYYGGYMTSRQSSTRAESPQATLPPPITKAQKPHVTPNLPVGEESDSADGDAGSSRTVKALLSLTVRRPFSPRQRLTAERIIAAVTHDAENYVVVDLTGHTDGQAIRERILSKLHIPDDLHSSFSIYRTDLGCFAISPALDDTQLLTACQQFGDDKGSLKFLAQRFNAPVESSADPDSDEGMPAESAMYSGGYMMSRQSVMRAESPQTTLPPPMPNQVLPPLDQGLTRTRKPHVTPNLPISEDSDDADAESVQMVSTQSPRVRRLLLPPQRLTAERIIVAVTHDAENYVVVDLTGHTDGQAIRERILSKLHIPDDLHSSFSIYRTALGCFAVSPALDDTQLLTACQQFGDDKGSLKFLAQRSDAPVEGEPAIPVPPPTIDPVPPMLPSLSSFSPGAMRMRSSRRPGSASPASDRLANANAGYEASVSAVSDFEPTDGVETRWPIQTLHRDTARRGRQPSTSWRVRRRGSGSADPDMSVSTPTVASALPMPQRSTTKRIIVAVTHDTENFVVIDLTHTDAQAIRERILSRLHIPDDLHSSFSIYRTDLGGFAIGVALDDTQLLTACQQFGDDKGSLKFLAQRSDDPVEGERAIPVPPPTIAPVPPMLPSLSSFSPGAMRMPSSRRPGSASPTSDLEAEERRREEERERWQAKQKADLAAKRERWASEHPGWTNGAAYQNGGYQNSGQYMGSGSSSGFMARSLQAANVVYPPARAGGPARSGSAHGRWPGEEHPPSEQPYRGYSQQTWAPAQLQDPYYGRRSTEEQRPRQPSLGNTNFVQQAPPPPFYSQAQPYPPQQAYNQQQPFPQQPYPAQQQPYYAGSGRPLPPLSRGAMLPHTQGSFAQETQQSSYDQDTHR